MIVSSVIKYDNLRELVPTSVRTRRAALAKLSCELAIRADMREVLRCERTGKFERKLRVWQRDLHLLSVAAKGCAV